MKAALKIARKFCISDSYQTILQGCYSYYQSDLTFFEDLKLNWWTQDCFFVNFKTLNPLVETIKQLVNQVDENYWLDRAWINNFIYANHVIEFEIFPKYLVKIILDQDQKALLPSLIKQQVENMANAIIYFENKNGRLNHRLYQSFYIRLIKNLPKGKRFYDGKYYRLNPVYIGYHQGVDSKQLHSLMNNLFKFINKCRFENDLIKIIVSHYYYEYLHPYYDFNGRSGRILMLWMAANNWKWVIKQLVWILSFKIKDYHKAFNYSQFGNNGDLTFFCQTMLKLMVKGLEWLIYLQNLKIDDKQNFDINGYEFDVLTIIFLEKRLTIKQLKKQFCNRYASINKQNLDQDFEIIIIKLTQSGLIHVNDKIVQLK